MRPWIRWTTALSGVLICATGLVATWRVLTPAEGGAGFPGATLDGWMFEGPALVTFGLLLLWTAGGGSDGASLYARAPRLLMQIGFAFLALPAATWAWNRFAPTMASYYAWTFAAFALGVPGAALALTGLALWMWRRSRGG
ncbi:MAG: hypothetical protein Q8W45_06625 [Candidatus Palauibacterales bacterium]|nr:hypothetical protein [Candidatus Palauibacterales bacterium]MDP2482938.1 hypothetical protein [Candidatus Palauibacterales bacterium]